MTKSAATAIGFTAVLMWAVLALLTAASGRVPPFQLVAMTFLIGGLVGAVTWPFRPGAARALIQDWRVWLIGVTGLFGFHVAFYSAIRLVPPVEATLIAYLWPLLLIVFSAMLPGERLKAHHLVGVALGFLGAVLVVTKGEGLGFEGGLRAGHLFAFACAVIWAGYSVLSRRFGAVSTDVVAGFCLATAALALPLHFVFEETAWPQTSLEWSAVLGMGLFPVGAAFYAWDWGVKRGDILVLGAASYAGPLLSTLMLVAAGFVSLHWSLVLACLAITAGATIAAKDMILGRA